MAGFSASGPSFLGSPRAADAGAVAARAVVAPALGSCLGRIVENPPAIGIGANFNALQLPVCQHFSKRSRNSRDHPSPVAPYWNRLRAKPILVLYELLPKRYVHHVIQSREFPGAEGASRGQFFRHAAQQVAQVLQFVARNIFRGERIKLPMLQERGEPPRI